MDNGLFVTIDNHKNSDSGDRQNNGGANFSGTVTIDDRQAKKDKISNIMRQGMENKDFTIKISTEIQRLVRYRKLIPYTVLNFIAESFRNMVNSVVEMTTKKNGVEMIDLTDISENQTEDEETAIVNDQTSEKPSENERENERDTLNKNFIEQRPNLFFMQENPGVTINGNGLMQVSRNNEIQRQAPKPKLQTYKNRRKEKMAAVVPYNIARLNVNQLAYDPGRVIPSHYILNTQPEAQNYNAFNQAHNMYNLQNQTQSSYSQDSGYNYYQTYQN